ncbi:MAG: hypothetical protein BGO31_12640 [Bacteroidetes bacterium 43-16]|nr:MAG: hypothetical protein BGO31_12640 [Bacteroidetes bacterium 43-16]
MITEEFSWGDYEKKVYKAICDAFPESDISFDDSILGIYSKAERQVDFAIRHNVAGKRILGIVDCKYYNKNIDVKMVESFIGMMQDVNANFGFLVTNNGYSQAAKNRVKFSNLKLDVLEVNELKEIEITADYFLNQNIKGLQLSKAEFLRRGKQNTNFFDEEKSDYKKRRIVFKEGYANYEFYAFKKLFESIARAFRDFEQLEHVEVFIPAKKNDASTSHQDIKYLYSVNTSKHKFVEFMNLNFDHLREDIKNWRSDFINTTSSSKTNIGKFASQFVTSKKYTDYESIVFNK